jgi:hypothetical protein
VDLSIENGGYFHSFFYVYQRLIISIPSSFRPNPAPVHPVAPWPPWPVAPVAPGPSIPPRRKLSAGQRAPTGSHVGFRAETQPENMGKSWPRLKKCLVALKSPDFMGLLNLLIMLCLTIDEWDIQKICVKTL